VVLVMVDEPQGNKESFGFATAGWTAAPAVGKIIERIAPILGVMPQPIYDPPLPDSKQVQMVHAGGKIDPATE